MRTATVARIPERSPIAEHTLMSEYTELKNFVFQTLADWKPEQLEAHGLDALFARVSTDETDTASDDVSTLEGKKHLLATLSNSIRDKLLSHADQWPAEWNGHELKALLAKAVESSTSRVMLDDKKRRQAFENEWTVRNLY